MIKDEFNNVEVKNESAIEKAEFGRTQKTEFSEQGKVENHSSKKPSLPKESTSVSETSVTTAAPTVTTVASSATASSIAATSTSVVVVATTVAVTAISVVTGISVSLHDYEYKFNSFLVTSDSLSYELLIIDNKNRPDDRPYEEYEEYPSYDHPSEKEYKEPFTIRVYNTDYDYSLSAWLDEPNYGTFTGLKFNEKYRIVLSENRYGGEVLFDEEFTTKKGAGITDFYISSGYNSHTQTIETYVNYVDELDALSDFTLNLTDGSNKLTLPLNKQNGWQTLDIGDFEINTSSEYDYTFTYKYNEEVKEHTSGKVVFYDTFSGESKFNGFIFDKTANFINKTFDVQLDFVDDYDVYDNFVLSFFMDDSALDISIPLEKTTDVQTINAEDNDIALSNTYTYQLTCLYNGETMILDSGEVTFIDNSGAIVEFNGLIFDKTANFDNRTFDVKLDYRDDLDYLYGFEFTLEDLETKQSKTFNLEKTDEVQTLSVNETSGTNEYDEPIYLIDVVEHEMQYSFKYWNVDQEIIVVDQEIFNFKNSLVSQFFDIDTTYDFVSETSDGPFMLPIKFDYDDAAHIYSDFMVTFTVEDEEVGYLMFEGSSVQKYWQYGTYQAVDDLMMAEDLTETSSPVMMNISALVPETDENPTGLMHLMSKEVNLTMNTTKAIYGATVVNDYIYYGSYEITILPIYSGPSDEIECTLIIETATGKTYTCNVNLDEKGLYTNVLLTECENFNEEEFGQDFEEPVKLSLKYCTLTYDDNGTSTMSEPIKSEYYTLVLYDSFKFNLSA